MIKQYAYKKSCPKCFALLKGEARFCSQCGAEQPNKYYVTEFEVDDDGFLLRFDDYCKEWADGVQDEEGVKEITQEINEIINFLQDYYRKNGITPQERILIKSLGFSPRDFKIILSEFKSEYAGICRMAGLPKSFS